ncbi:DMT family transporter [Enterovirga sp.]|uniref:DMT family transporter n=1 Tax=Enterovirga sp. TaxID=2026350 RepID=UPI002633BAC9|nr:DMT family transporter [Enterovirga sp.]MDB5591772.1 transporter [Enterovirga sp.]
MIRNAALVVLLGIGWGLNWPAVKLALQEIPPWTLRAVGFSAATVLMFVAIRALGLSPAVPRRHWLRLACVGALSVAVYNLLSAYSQVTASTSRAAVLSYTMPIWAVIGARVVLGERIDRRRILGLGLGAAGLLALGWPVVQAGTFSVGLVYALLSGMVWATGSVLLKRYPIEAPPLVISTWQMALGAVMAATGMVWVEGVPRGLPTLPSAWFGLGYNILIGQALATTLWFTILARMSAGMASLGTLLVPGVGVIGATLILGERPTWSDWLGLALIVAASATVLLRDVERPAETNR